MSLFELSSQPLDLKLDQPFTISRGTKDEVNNVLIEFTDGEYTGFGEAAPNARYDEDAGKVAAFIREIPETFFDDISEPAMVMNKLGEITPQIQSAKVAVEMAWLDWWGRRNDQPLWKLWKAPTATGPVTSYTIGLDETDVMQQKVEAAPEYPIYKVKLGTDRDREIIKALREVTDKPIRVDANEGWTTLDKAKTMVEFLEGQNIELIEQPMPAGQSEDLKALKKWSPLPQCADESFMGDETLGDIAEAFDVINIKLMKIGSMIKARHVIQQARKLDLGVMVGCMIESSVANTAGALLGLWADYVDMDGHLLIADDPAEGLTLTDEKNIHLTDRPGLGIRMR